MEYPAGIAGERIWLILKKRGVRMTDLSRESQIAYQTLRSIVVGKTNGNAFTLAKIADALGVSMDYLMGRTEVKKWRK